MSKIMRRLGAVLGAVTLLGSMAACSPAAAPDYTLVRYEYETNGKRSFDKCVQPSTLGDVLANDEIFALPVSLRTWNIRPQGQGGDSNTPVYTGTKPQPATKDRPAQPGPEVSVFAKTEFYLNTSCKEQKPDGSLVTPDDSAKSPIVRFWEATGRRYGVASDGETGFSQDGWNNMLQATLVPAMEKAVRSSSRNFDGDDLDSNTNNVWSLMERQMGATFSAELNASVGGGDYFCGPTYKRNADGSAAVVSWTEPVPDPNKPGAYIDQPKKGICPPVRISITDVNFKDERIAAARIESYAQDQRNQAALSKAEADKQVASLAKDPNVMRLKEMENERAIAEACAKPGANCTLIQGVGGGVNVNAGK
jgi:hypothetical protein